LAHKGITANCGIVSGGTATNIIPETCKTNIAHRFLSPADCEEVNGAVVKLAAETECKFGGNIKMTKVWDFKPLERRRESPIRDLAMSAGGCMKAGSFGACSEASAFQEIGIDTILCGPGSLGQAHNPNEFITLYQMKTYDDFLAGIMNRFGKQI